jgi:hypothetical protein
MRIPANKLQDSQLGPYGYSVRSELAKERPMPSSAYTRDFRLTASLQASAARVLLVLPACFTLRNQPGS